MELSLKEMPVGSLLRLIIRLLKNFLPLFLICMTFVLTMSVWRMLNDASVNLLVTSRTNTIEQDDQSNLLQSNYVPHKPIVKRYIHRTKLLCTAVCPGTFFLLILVSSNVGNFGRRQIIRNTWGADFAINTRWKTVFLLGKNSND